MNICLIDFDQSPRSAFYQGFQKGLGAPCLLFGEFQVPQTTEVMQVQVPVFDPGAALSGDWARVGNDLRSALSQYAETYEKDL